MGEVLRPSTARRVAEMLLLGGGLLLVVTGAFYAMVGIQAVIVTMGEDHHPLARWLVGAFVGLGVAMLLAGGAHLLARKWFRARRRWADWYAVALALTWPFWAFWLYTAVAALLDPHLRRG